MTDLCSVNWKIGRKEVIVQRILGNLKKSMTNFLPLFGSQTWLKYPRNEICPSQKKETLERRNMSSRSMSGDYYWNRDVLGCHLQAREAPLRRKSTALLSLWEKGQPFFSRLTCNLLSMAHLTWSFYFGQWNRMPPMKLSLGSSPGFELPVKFSIRSKSNGQLVFTPRAPADQGKAHYNSFSSLAFF